MKSAYLRPSFDLMSVFLSWSYHICCPLAR